MSCKQCINDGGPGPCTSAPCWMLCQQLGAACNTIIMGGLGRTVIKEKSAADSLKSLFDIQAENPEIGGLALGIRGFTILRGDNFLSSVGIEWGDVLITVDGAPVTFESFHNLYEEGQHSAIWYSIKQAEYQQAEFKTAIVTLEPPKEVK